MVKENERIPDASLIVPVYQSACYLPDFIRSLVKQKNRNIEILLVDDGSTDGSGEICDRYAEQDTRIHVIHQKNQGTGAARNAGMDAAKGRYLYFCDPDDRVDGNLIHDNVKLADETGADMVTFCYRVEQADRSGTHVQIEKKQFSKSAVIGGQEFWKHFREEYAAGGCVWNRMFRRSMIEKHHLRMNQQTKGEDTAFLYRIYAIPPAVTVYNPEQYYTYVKREGSLSTTAHPQRMEEEYQTSRLFDEVVSSHTPEYRDLICSRYVECYSAALENMARDRTLSFWEKRDYAVRYLKKPNIRQAVRKIPLNLGRHRLFQIKLLLMKLGMVTILVACQECMQYKRGRKKSK
jgi:glycosyltransferase involved in cell wall biosynthesis